MVNKIMTVYKLIRKGLFNLILNSVLGILSYIIPKDNNLLLIGSINFSDNAKYFHLYLNTNKTPFKSYWITRDKSIYKKLEEYNLPVVYLYSLNGFIKILHAKYILFTHGPIDVSYSFMLPGRFKMVQLMHGLPLKKIGYKAHKNIPMTYYMIKKLEHINESSYHLITVTSEYIKDIVANTFENNNVKVLGYPRNDVFLHIKL